MKHFLFVLVVVGGIFGANVIHAQPLEILIKSLPVFAAYAEVKAEDDVLTVGIYSEKGIDPVVLQAFGEIKSWSAEGVNTITKHKRIKITPVSLTNIDRFNGQILWVMDTTDTIALKKQTEQGVFTIGAQDPRYQNYLFTTLIYHDTSDDPKVKKWRLTELIANCDLSPLRFSTKITNKKYFVGKSCD